MSLTAWVTLIALILSAIVALLNAFLSSRSGQEYIKAKQARDKETEAAIKAKEAQVGTLRKEMEQLGKILGQDEKK